MEAPIIIQAVEKLRQSFGGTNVEILSPELERINNIGGDGSILGVYITIQGIKTFLHYQYAEDMVITPTGYGQKLADELVLNVLKAAHPEKFKTKRII